MANRVTCPACGAHRPAFVTECGKCAARAQAAIDNPCRKWRESPYSAHGWLRCQLAAGHAGPHVDPDGNPFTRTV